MSNKKLERLYREYHLMVKDVAYKVLDDYYLAQDICHDVFVKLTDEWISQEKSEEYIKNYLTMVAYNSAVDYIRENKRVMLDSDVNIYRDKENDISTTVENNLVYKKLATSMLNELKEHNKKWYLALFNVEVCQIPAVEVARANHISEMTVRTWLRRAKQWIKKHYREEYEKIDKDY